MLDVYLILPEALEPLRDVLQRYKGADKEPIFQISGISNSVDRFYKSLIHKEDFHANIILIFSENMTEQTMAHIEGLCERYDNKFFYLILNSHNKKLMAKKHNNLQALYFYKKDKPISISTLTKNLVDALNNNGKVVEDMRLDNNIQKANMKKGKKSLKWQLSSYEIGMMGVKRGVGVTHTAIMIAKSLAKDYKTCIVELNEHGHFNNIFGETKKYFSREQGIDFYYGLEYGEFTKKYKSNYEVICLDFGCYDDVYDMDEYIRTNMRCVVAHGSDWKLEELRQFYEEVGQQDPQNNWKYLIPFTTYEGDIKKIINRQYMTVPFVMNPFQLTEEVKAGFRKIINE